MSETPALNPEKGVLLKIRMLPVLLSAIPGEVSYGLCLLVGWKWLEAFSVYRLDDCA